MVVGSAAVLAARAASGPVASGGLDAATIATDTAVEAFVQTNELFTENDLGDAFGVSVAVEGDTMVIGSWIGDNEQPGVCGNGLAYVYTRNGSPLWDLVARLQSSHNPLCYPEYFGHSVAISGDWIAVGAPKDPQLLPDRDETSTDPWDYNAQGSVYLFQKPAGGWQDATETASVTEFDGTFAAGTSFDHDDGFGAAIALEGDTLVVGAPGFDANGVASGAVFVYENPIDAGWERVARLTPSEPAVYTTFGGGIGLSNGTIVVGNFKVNAIPVAWYGQSGVPTSAYVFEEPLDGWPTADGETAKLTVEGWDTYAVAIDGDTVVTGNLFAGQAFVFAQPVGGWADAGPNAELVAGTTLSHYGHTVAVDGGNVLVGAPGASTRAFAAGEAFLFERPADGWGPSEEPPQLTWTERLEHADPRDYDTFGGSAVIDGTTIAIGAYQRSHWIEANGTENPDAGSVFVFGRTSDFDAPTTTIARDPATPTGGDGWDTAAVDLTVTADDGPDGSGVVQIRCQLDTVLPGATFADLPPPPCPYAGDGGATLSAEGTHTLFAASMDAAGNQSAVITLRVRIDTTPPGTPITLNPAEPDGTDGTYTTPVSVHLGFFDDPEGSGWEEVRCVLDPAVPPTSFDDLPTTLCGNDYFTGDGRLFEQDGSHTIWIAARDRAGNKSTPASRSFTIRTGPTVDIALSPSTPDGSAGWYRNPVRVSVSASTSNGQPIESIRCVLDPATPPATYTDLPATCPYLGTGALVSASGQHTVFAASRDSAGNTSPVESASFDLDVTPPDLTCEGTGPVALTIGEAAGTVSASVADEDSGPATETATATLTDADLDTVGHRTVEVTAGDVAGNESTVDCAYVVGYDLEILTPLPGDSFRLGSSISVTFTLEDADGNRIPDADAATLAGGKRIPCYIDALFDDRLLRGCPTYSATTQQFTFVVKTPKSRSAAGLHDIAIQVRAPDGTGVVNLERVVITLTP